GRAERGRSANRNPRRIAKEIAIRTRNGTSGPSAPFPSAGGLPIWGVPVSAGYEDKWCRGIDTADPGAVPGGSTTNPQACGLLTGPNQDRRVFKDDIFFRAE